MPWLVRPPIFRLPMNPSPSPLHVLRLRDSIIWNRIFPVMQLPFLCPFFFSFLWIIVFIAFYRVTIGWTVCSLSMCRCLPLALRISWIAATIQIAKESFVHTVPLLRRLSVYASGFAFDLFLCYSIDLTPLLIAIEGEWANGIRNFRMKCIKMEKCVQRLVIYNMSYY